MSSGKTHTEIGIYGIIASAAVAALSLDADALALPVGVAVNTYLLSPDLDLIRNDARNNWGWLKFIWWPFAVVVPHRSPFSHWPIVGTFTKNLYLAGIVLLVAVMLTSWPQVWDFLQNITLPESAKWFFSGQIAGDGLHLVMDLTSTGTKRVARKIFSRRKHFRRV